MILGIDTSCYTTSLAAIDNDKNLIADCRKLLDVKEGKRGMAQSEMFFSHSNCLPKLLKELYSKIDKNTLECIAVSTKPRPVEGSYMPAFRAGENLAEIISQDLGLPVFRTTHQEGHIAAALWSLAQQGLLSEKLNQSFIAVHLSGGTSEILKVNNHRHSFEIEIISSADLAAGQFIDRVGTSLGLPFPSGPHLEMLAQKATINIELPVTVKDNIFYFSGGYTAVQQLKLSENYTDFDLSNSVFRCIGKTISKAVLKATAKTNLNQVVLCGGVMKNQIIKRIMLEEISDKCKLFFSDPVYSGDNSVGVAVLGLNWVSTL